MCVGCHKSLNQFLINTRNFKLYDDIGQSELTHCGHLTVLDTGADLNLIQFDNLPAEALRLIQPDPLLSTCEANS